MWEVASYVVTVIGLPVAIVFYVLDRLQQRGQEEEETYIQLSDEYVDFLKLALEHADLQLLDPNPTLELTQDQHVRKTVLLGILVSLFERAYILTYRPGMKGSELRRWHSWEDWMREWCSRLDFREAMARHLPGEDPQFIQYWQSIADEEAKRKPPLEMKQHHDTAEKPRPRTRQEGPEPVRHRSCSSYPKPPPTRSP